MVTALIWTRGLPPLERPVTAVSSIWTTASAPWGTAPPAQRLLQNSVSYLLAHRRCIGNNRCLDLTYDCKTHSFHRSLIGQWNMTQRTYCPNSRLSLFVCENNCGMWPSSGLLTPLTAGCNPRRRARRMIAA